MDALVNNASAFSSEGFIGSDGAGVNFYLHWDATYLYFGWEGGQTHYNGSPHTDCSGTQSSDMYFVGIDTQNDSGSNEDIGIVSFSNSVIDYYAVYENNYTHYNGSQGDGRELWVFSGGNWISAIPRLHPADNGMDGQIDFQCSPNGSVRFRISWANISFTPGPNSPIAFTFWNNNGANNWLWASFPTANPVSTSSGATVTLTHKLKFNSTGSGVDPSSDGAIVSLSTSLPIELIDFDAIAKDANVELDWSTASERSSSHFDIEHSIDGALFESIGRLETAGESSILQHYEFEHVDPASGNNYYRLAHYDLDGTLSYSDIESVYFGKGKSISIFPNPVNGSFTISTSEDYNIGSFSVFDMQGGLVEQKSVIQYRNNIEVETTEWRNGVYQVLVVYLDGTTAVKNIIKQ